MIMQIGKLLENISFESSNPLIMPFTVYLSPDDKDILVFEYKDRKDLPVHISVNSESNEIIFLSFLFKESDIKTDTISDLNRLLLASNVSTPLSSFAILDDNYVLYGSLDAHSSIDIVMNEIDFLVQNSLDTLESLEDYFN